MWAWIELIGIILLIVWACQPSGSKKKNNHTSHYPGGYTMNHTPPARTDDEIPTPKFEGGYHGELNKEFENK